MPDMNGRAMARLEARFAPATVDDEARTVEVTFTTGAPVARRDYWTGESWVEELEVSERAMDLTRLNAGAPFLNSHRGWDLGDVIGVVERAWIEGKEGRATLRFSDREEVAPIFADVRAGILRNISVGYSVSEWKESKRDDGTRVKRGIRWQPAEISLVPIPADASAQVRAADAPPAHGTTIIINTQESRMADPVTNAPADPALNAPVITAPAVNEDQVRAAERTRIATLRAAGEVAGSILERGAIAEVETQAVSEGWSPERFRAALLDKAVAGGQRVVAPTLTPVSQMGRSGDDPTAIAVAMATALAVRAMPKLAAEQPDQRWREFASLRPTDMLIELAAARGERVGPRDRMALIERAFHTTSDFPMLLENAGNKMLESGYAAAAPSYRTFFGQRSFNDFKAHKFLTAGDFPALAELAEGGEITSGTISEKRESITAKTYAKGIAVTRQMLINDDLGAFSEFGTMIGRRVADQENALAYALVNSATGNGPTLAEGAAAVFTTGRGNKAAAGSAISEAALDAGYAGMMGMTSLDGIKLNVQPAILLTGAAYRGTAIRYTTRLIQPDSGANVGLYSNLTPVSDANITGNRWYLFADPAAAPVYVYGYVNGATAPQVRVFSQVQGRDGMVVEVLHDFAVGAIDFRGGWFNAGA